MHMSRKQIHTHTYTRTQRIRGRQGLSEKNKLDEFGMKAAFDQESKKVRLSSIRQMPGTASAVAPSATPAGYSPSSFATDVGVDDAGVDCTVSAGEGGVGGSGGADSISADTFEADTARVFASNPFDAI